MQGSQDIRFIELFTDTLQSFGMEFASTYYMKHGMSRKEFRMWARIAYRAY
jgi:hypothetical protein